MANSPAANLPAMATSATAALRRIADLAVTGFENRRRARDHDKERDHVGDDAADKSRPSEPDVAGACRSPPRQWRPAIEWHPRRDRRADQTDHQ